MTKTLRNLAEKHAVIFWILCVLVFVVGYKTVSVGLLSNTPYKYGIAFFKLSLALLSILMMKSIYHGRFCFYFRKENFGKGLLLLWPALLFLLANLLTPDTFSDRGVVAETLIMVVITNMITGVYEEVVMRGMLLGHMMQHWKDDEHKILKSVLTTSVLFGVVHLGNLAQAPLGPTLFQVVYATVFGLLFAATYLRTKNIWSCVLIHGLVDVSGEVCTIYYYPGEPIEGLFGAFVPLMVLSTVICLVVSLFELRKKRCAEIKALWAECEVDPVA